MSDLEQRVKDAAKAEPFLKQSLDMVFDAERRVCLATLRTERARFAIKDPDPVVVPIPFHAIQEAAAQILTFDAEMMLEKLPFGARQNPKKWPKGVAGVRRVAQLLQESADAEKTGRAVMEENQPVFQPNLELIMGKEEPDDH